MTGFHHRQQKVIRALNLAWSLTFLLLDDDSAICDFWKLFPWRGNESSLQWITVGSRIHLNCSWEWKGCQERARGKLTSLSPLEKHMMMKSRPMMICWNRTPVRIVKSCPRKCHIYCCLMNQELYTAAVLLNGSMNMALLTLQNVLHKVYILLDLRMSFLIWLAQ